MTLRLILVGLVTSMGLELPSGRDVSSWAESGRAWADARFTDLPAPSVEVVPAIESADLDPAPGPVIVAAARCIQPDADRVFDAVSEGMAADFASDRAVTVAGIPASAADSDATVAESGMPAVGLPEGEELATAYAPGVEDAPAEAAGPASGDEPTEAAAAEDDAPSRADRLSSAVRMTREVVHAWAALIQDSAEEAGPAR